MLKNNHNLLSKFFTLSTVFFKQNDIMDVNEIFRDLGTMIHEQGEMIGKISLALG